MVWIPSKKVLSKLICSTCKNYISVGPIKQAPVGYNCGRCLTNGDETNPLFEVLAKECLFPCRYDKSGCTMTLSFGEEVLNHEKICEYRLIPCPVIDTCEWKGPASTSFQHCLEKHEECIRKFPKFTLCVELEQSINKKMLMKKENGDLLLLHILYSAEIGLSTNLKLLIEKNCNTNIYRYTLLIQSSNLKDKTELNNRKIDPCFSPEPSFQWIPYNTLSCLDKNSVLLTISIEIDQKNISKFECNSCEETAPLYVLKCAKNHRFCRDCCDIKQKCTICNSFLKISTNYDAINTNGAILGCCNAIHGCTFSSTLIDLKEHEKKCVLKKCLVENCNWEGLDNSYTLHLNSRTALHCATTNKVIEIKELAICNTTYLMWKVGYCPNGGYSYSSHKHKEALFLIQTVVDNTNKTVKIIANYVDSGDTKFIGGKFKVTIGTQYITYNSVIGKMISAKIDRNSEIHICRSLIKQHRFLTIELDCSVNCN